MVVGVLITLCSKNQDWDTLHNCDFFSVFLNSYQMTKTPSHKHRIYLGYDENDKFFVKHRQEIIDRLPKDSKVVVLPKWCNGNPCEAWNILFKTAYNDDCEYFYQCGSDIVHNVRGWDDYFINLMKKNDNDCIVGGVDARCWIQRCLINETGILENVFTGRKHYERFGWFFPPEVKTWYSDDLITKIYMNVNKCFICPNIQYQNTNRVGDINDRSRYVPPVNTPIATSWKQLANTYTLKGFFNSNKQLARTRTMPISNKIDIHN